MTPLVSRFVRRVPTVAAGGLLLVISIGVGAASAHIASGVFFHTADTVADHSAGVGSYDCGAFYVGFTASHWDYDTQSHVASIWQRDYYSGSGLSLTWGFSTVGSRNWDPNFSHRIDAMTSGVSPIHSWHDLVYPRYKHGISVNCHN